MMDMCVAVDREKGTWATYLCVWGPQDPGHGERQICCGGYRTYRISSRPSISWIYLAPKPPSAQDVTQEVQTLITIDTESLYHF